jgi:hypothetical protein
VALGRREKQGKQEGLCIVHTELMEFFNAFNRLGQYTGFDTNVSDGSNSGNASNRQNSPRSIQAQLRFTY